jgi:hypothetical protein
MLKLAGRPQARRNQGEVTMRRQVVSLALVLGLVAIGVAAGRARASSSALPQAPTAARGAAAPAGAAQAPSQQLASNAVFFDNLGAGRSFSGSSWCVTGTSTPCGRFDEAMPFVPSVSGRVQEIDIAAVHSSGPNATIVQLAQDNGGVPGAVLASTGVINSPPSGSTCCAGVATVSPSVPIGAGHTYWVIARAPASTTYNGWAWNPNFTTGTFAYSQNGGSTWSTTYSYIGAFAVVGCSKVCKVN